MLIIPVRTGHISVGDDLGGIIADAVALQENDIVVVSSKVAATVEGSAVKLSEIVPSEEAQKLFADYGKSPQHREFVLRETKRMKGKIIRTTNGVVLTELNPEGLDGSLLVPNAGIDESNIDHGWAVGWPKDPVETVRKLREELTKRIQTTQRTKRIQRSESSSGASGSSGSSRLAIILTDSGLSPRRSGVTAFALAVAGIDPLFDRRGKPDLYGRDMVMTIEAVADQLATAANFVMGNADERTPAAVIRDHGLPFTDFEGWVPGIEREKDIYYGVV